MRLKSYIATGIVVIPLALLFALSCTPREHYAGTYSSPALSSPKQSEVVIELKEDGQGLWRTLDQEVSFRWSTRGGEIRLHTRDGGVIIGKINDKSLQIKLPGARTVSFKKEEPGV